MVDRVDPDAEEPEGWDAGEDGPWEPPVIQGAEVFDLMVKIGETSPDPASPASPPAQSRVISRVISHLHNGIQLTGPQLMHPPPLRGHQLTRILRLAVTGGGSNASGLADAYSVSSSPQAP